jgi:hypothetical protein
MISFVYRRMDATVTFTETRRRRFAEPQLTPGSRPFTVKKINGPVVPGLATAASHDATLSDR